VKFAVGYLRHRPKEQEYSHRRSGQETLFMPS